MSTLNDIERGEYCRKHKEMFFNGECKICNPPKRVTRNWGGLIWRFLLISGGIGLLYHWWNL